MNTLPPLTRTAHASAAPHAHGAPRDLTRTPLNVYWEMTRACGLACRHCRAAAVRDPDPDELDFAASLRLLEQIAGFGAPLPHLIMTGGDPLLRPDVFELLDAAGALGIEVSITPAATPDLTPDVIAKLQAHHVAGLGLSLDGSNAARHEAVRGVAGCFEWTRSALRAARTYALPVQVNTLVAAETADDLPALYELLCGEGIARWSLFFLIAVGRGALLEPVSPARGEEIMRWALARAEDAPFVIATTEAPSYRRVALEDLRARGASAEAMRRAPVRRGFGIRDGNGVVFVSSTGEIYPAGFLPVAVGNVREDALAEVYRSAPLMRDLHDPNTFHGKCGRCEYRMLCGGSRARAYAQTGDALASDPFCPYEPAREVQKCLV